MIRPPPRSTLFPYTPLSRSVQSAGRRDFSSASDVARGIGLALDLPADGRHRVYNIATGVGTTFRALADLLVELTDSASPIERSEEHTSELQSQSNLVCRLLL